MAEGDKKGPARRSRRRAVRTLHGVLFGLVVGAVVLLLGQSKFLQRMEMLTVDARYRLAPAPAFRGDIGYVDFDETSVALCGKWVWPRHRQVTLINTLARYRARALGYDVFFTEPNEIAFRPERLARIADAGARDVDTVAALREAFRDYDGEMAEALASAGNVFLGDFMVMAPDTASADSIAQETARLRAEMTEEQRASLEILRSFRLRDDPRVAARLIRTTLVFSPIARLESAAAGVGFAQPTFDLDKTVRMYPLCFAYDSGVYPSIAVAILCRVFDVLPASVQVDPGSHVAFPGARMPRDPGFGPADTSRIEAAVRIPVDEHGLMMVNWGGRFYDCGLHLSYRDVARIAAWDRAKAVAREVGERGTPPSAMADAIRERLADEQLVMEDEGREIAAHVTAAWVLESTAAADALSEETASRAVAALRDLLPDEAGLSVLQAGAIARGGTVPPGFPEPWARAIRREVDFVTRHGLLDEARPLYFPPPFPVLWQGRWRSFTPADIEGRIFMAGLTGKGTIDVNPSPFESECPMVAFHANTLNTILTGQFIHPYGTAERLLAVLSLAAIAGIAGSLLTPARAFAACGALALLYTAFVFRSWSDGAWRPWVEPLLAVAVIYLGQVIAKYMYAAREKQKIRSIFSTMVSPKVLKLMEDHPERFSLTGERMHATTFFSMIEGFGPIMQREAPDELGVILGWYLTPTSEIIMDYDGYIDKYEGHIIMADFGVPLADPDHAWKCCYAALEQQQDIEAFRMFILARYGTEISVTMGLNAGYVSGGMMGSEKKMQYTVMGDAVNVAARFRPANLIYGTGIITGETTEPFIRDTVELRLLDRLLLKGKTKPTAIHEVLGWKPDAYRRLKGDRPVPESLLARWSKCPPEKVFGYAAFYRRMEVEHAAPLAGEIAGFFESMGPVAERIMLPSTVLMLQRMRADIEHLAELAASLDGAAEPTTGAAPSGWQAHLDTWLERIRRIDERLQEAERSGRPLPPHLPTIPEMRLMAATMTGKIRTLAENLPKKPKSGLEEVARALATIRGWLEGREMPDAAERFAVAVAEYRTAALAFHGRIASRPREYHEMMALIGSPTTAMGRVRELYEEALRLHWERRWDEALARLEQALQVLPADGPALALVERIRGYRVEEPGANWQGEFVQKKK